MRTKQAPMKLANCKMSIPAVKATTRTKKKYTQYLLVSFCIATGLTHFRNSPIFISHWFHFQPSKNGYSVITSGITISISSFSSFRWNLNFFILSTGWLSVNKLDDIICVFFFVTAVVLIFEKKKNTRTEKFHMDVLRTTRISVYLVCIYNKNALYVCKIVCQNDDI